MREQAADQARQFAEAGGISWPLAVRTAAAAGVAALALGLLGVALPPLVLLSFLWAVMAPAVAVRLYGARLPGAGVTASFGARLGLLTALFVCLANTTVNVLDLTLTRFVLHGAGPRDAEVQAFWTQMLASQTGPGSDVLAGLLRIPEFRVGFVLSGAVISVVVYLLVTSLIGALAGQMRSAAAARR
jgi:hypothetical protein